jgi:hypothetical protein
MSPTTDSPRRQGVEQALAVVSAVLLPLGIAMILLGWYGASHTPYLFEQVPYLISGGLLGLGVAVVGGLFYFGSWVARGAAEQQRQGEAVAALLKDIRDELRSRTAASTNGGPPPFVATAKGGMLHRPDCAVVAGRTDLRSIGATGDGLAPCTLCSPYESDVLAH